MKIFVVIITILAGINAFSSGDSGKQKAPGIYAHEMSLPNPEQAVIETNSVDTMGSKTVNGYSLLDFCSTEFNDDKMNDCIDVVKGETIFFSALESCKKHKTKYKTNYGQKLACLGIIRNKRFMPGALEICNKNEGADLNVCLAIISDQQLAANDYTICGKNGIGRERNSCLLRFMSGGKGFDILTGKLQSFTKSFDINFALPKDKTKSFTESFDINFVLPKDKKDRRYIFRLQCHSFVDQNSSLRTAARHNSVLLNGSSKSKSTSAWWFGYEICNQLWSQVK